MEHTELGDYLVVDDTGAFDKCSYGEEEVACESGPPGKMLCRRVNVYPNYQGDIVMQERQRDERPEEESSFFNILSDRL